MRKFAFLIQGFLCYLNIQAQQVFLLAGSYDGNGSSGLFVYEYDLLTAETKLLHNYKTSNASFFSVSPNEKYVYVVEEIKSREGFGGKLKALAFHKQNGTLTLLNVQNTWGDHPCHVMNDPEGKMVFVSNYSGGNLSVFRTLTQGEISNAVVIPQLGSGPHPAQGSSHLHSSILSPDGNYLVTANLGTDKLTSYRIDRANSKLQLQEVMSTVPGSGPRMMCFHPSHSILYVIEELSGTISSFNYKKGKLKKKQRISTMVAGDTSFAGSAHLAISPDGKFLYASNRGSANNIAIFSIDKKGGLQLLAHQSTIGRGPRHFTLDPSGKFLLVANQQSDVVVIFNRDPVTGMLKDSGKRISITRPVCLGFID